MEDDSYVERVSALLKVVNARRFVKEDNVPCEIEKGLYLGSLGAAENWHALRRFNITHILTVANYFQPLYPEKFTYKTISVADREDVVLSQFFDECIGFIEEARGNDGAVLVHCFAGRSRSATIVVAYLMFKNSLSLSEALDYVKLRRPCVCPNPGFLRQLQTYEQALRELEDRGAACSGRAEQSDRKT